MNRFLINMKPALIALAVFMAACGGSASSDKKAAVTGEAVEEKGGVVVDYAPPSAPVMMTSLAERLEFYGLHYWDDFDFKDSVRLQQRGYVEQAWANYLPVVGQLSVDASGASLRNTMALASVDSLAFATFCEVAEKYLYNPNSPLRNEELFIPVLEYIVASPKVDSLMKLRPEHLLRLALKNRVGEVAADFNYTLSGKSKQLKMHDIEADFTLLFFNDPKCDDCVRVKEVIASSQLLESLVRVGAPKLAILSVCIEDDIEAWKNSSYPNFVINAYDTNSTIRNSELYDLKASPTLYLLDSDKKVIVKDGSIEQIVEVLDRLSRR